MAANSNNSYITSIDPIQALIDYINDIKPYHSKIVETNVEYVDTDTASTTMVETLAFAWATPIQNTSTTDVIVQGDETHNLAQGRTITIQGSAGNDGSYLVISLTFNGSITTIAVTPDLLPGSLGGSINYTNEIV